MSPPAVFAPLSGLQTKQDVAALLNVPLFRIAYLLYTLSPQRRFKTFALRGKAGRERTIEVPIKPLKMIQARLASILATSYRVPHNVHGYVPGRSIVTNARIHTRQEWVLRLDLESFFPSINFGRVRGLFVAAPFSCSPTAATLLAQICTHNNHLPQGAPTSPILSNLICRRLDRELGRLARSERCYYTRYCDDLVFSTNGRFPRSLATRDEDTSAVHIGDPLRAVIESNGFTINESKTFLRKRTQRQMVTGLVTNAFVNVPRDYIRSIHGLLDIWRRHGERAATERLLHHRPKNRPPFKDAPALPLVMRGKVQYVGAIKGWNNPVYLALASELRRLDPSYVRTMRVLDSPPTLFRVFAEGPTDLIHLEAAIKHFQQNGEFSDLDLHLERPTDQRGGGTELLTQCKLFARYRQKPPAVFIFDSDEQKVMPEVVGVGASFKPWGNNVFSFVIPTPAHRAAHQPLCIELLYTDELLERRDGQGRRIYRRDEFDPETGFHLTETVSNSRPKAESLVRDDDVFDWTTKGKVSLSKKGFAEAIAARKSPYETVAFEGFRRVFEVLREIRVRLLTT